jgi:hypothetical protein
MGDELHAVLSATNTGNKWMGLHGAGVDHATGLIMEQAQQHSGGKVMLRFSRAS